MSACKNCGVSAAVACGGCFDTFYCGAECQKQHWSTGGHRDFCVGKLAKNCAQCAAPIGSPVACRTCKSVVYCSHQCRAADVTHSDHICGALSGGDTRVTIGWANKEDALKIASDLGCDTIGEAIVAIGENPETTTSRSYLSTLWSYLHEVMRTITASTVSLGWETLVRSGSNVPPIAIISDSLARLAVKTRDVAIEVMVTAVNQIVAFYDWLVGVLKVDESAQTTQEESAVMSISDGKSEIAALRRIVESASVMANRVIRFMAGALNGVFRVLNAAFSRAADAVAEFVGDAVSYGVRFVDTASAAYTRINQFGVFVYQVYQIAAEFIGTAVYDLSDLLKSFAAYLTSFVDDIVVPVIVKRVINGLNPSGTLDWLGGTSLFRAVYPGVAAVSKVAQTVTWLWSAVSNPATLTYWLVSNVLRGLSRGIQALYAMFMENNAKLFGAAVMAPGDDDILRAAYALLRDDSPYTLNAKMRRNIKAKTDRFETLVKQTTLIIPDRADREGGYVKVASNMLRGAWKASKVVALSERTKQLDPSDDDNLFIMQHLHGIDRGTARELSTARETLVRFIGMAIGKELGFTLTPGGPITLQSIGAPGDDDKSALEEAEAQLRRSEEARERRRLAKMAITIPDKTTARLPPNRDDATKAIRANVQRNLVDQASQGVGLGLTFFELDGRKYAILPPGGGGPAVPSDVTLLDPKRPEDVVVLQRYNSQVAQLIGLGPKDQILAQTTQALGLVFAHSLLVQRGSWTNGYYNATSWLLSLLAFGVFSYIQYRPQFPSEAWKFDDSGFEPGFESVAALGNHGALAGFTFMVMGTPSLRADLDPYLPQQLKDDWLQITNQAPLWKTPWNLWTSHSAHARVARSASTLASVLATEFNVTKGSYYTSRSKFVNDEPVMKLLTAFVETGNKISYSVDTTKALDELAQVRTTIVSRSWNFFNWFGSEVAKTTTGGVDTAKIGSFMSDVVVPGMVVTQVLHFVMDIILSVHLSRKKGAGTASDDDLQTLEAIGDQQIGHRAIARLTATITLIGAAGFFKNYGIKALMDIGLWVGKSKAGALLVSLIPGVGQVQALAN